ncbi:aminoglycoside phosphotransferase family protein [Roseococcus sp. SYP-B2431]|uniref:phosphotransferase family protein n=1 Tax=Roseococcus sp. SYP-B2431 TaxID=2496640 RepID=UPI001040A96D|nr:phosphotransferase [Roseococcus sp. SYP-B2431]TCH99790.1 aminoglycoside phosphotransferase family protein [Roseococcus sp. SYP-B2431]
MKNIPEEMSQGLRAMGLLAPGALAQGEPLSGGVSSDIWRVVLPDGREACIKRALAKLKVAADWCVPVGRNRYEARWLARAAEAVPGVAPALLGQDEATGTLAMEWLSPADHPVWKARLRDGEADAGFAAEMGRRIARIHAFAAKRPALAAEFPTDELFHAIRLEPYLIATARAHPDLAEMLEGLAARTAATKRTLVHGDVSPKNILVGPNGPVLLDAECAWWGDPAFDLAFCLNHLLLKCLWTPRAAKGFLACFEAMGQAYLALVDWEAREEIEGRAASLLPGLLLARVDGKSPAEYLTGEDDRNRVRGVARALLQAPPARLDAVRRAWGEEIGA